MWEGKGKGKEARNNIRQNNAGQWFEVANLLFHEKVQREMREREREGKLGRKVFENVALKVCQVVRNPLETNDFLTLQVQVQVFFVVF